MFEAKFQTFTDASAPTLGTARLKLLRAELERRGLDGFLIPRADAHQNEYVPPSDERLTWLTGFTGSAGTALVLRDKAAIVVDGRYTLQAAAQVDTASFEVVPLADTTPERWIEKNLPAGGHLGYDPWLITQDGLERLRRAVALAEGTLVAVEGNPLDAVWTDRPPAPLAPVVIRDPALAGEPVEAKLDRLRAALAEQKLLPDPLQQLMEQDESLYGVDETLALGIVHVYGMIGLTSFGYLDKKKNGIIRDLNDHSTSIHVFLDDLVAGLAAAASARIAHKHQDELDGQT